jgi:hypothetical protein
LLPSHRFPLPVAHCRELIRVTQDLISLDADERAFPGRRTRQRDLPRTDVQEIHKFGENRSEAALSFSRGRRLGRLSLKLALQDLLKMQRRTGPSVPERGSLRASRA